MKNSAPTLPRFQIYLSGAGIACLARVACVVRDNYKYSRARAAKDGNITNASSTSFSNCHGFNATEVMVLRNMQLGKRINEWLAPALFETNFEC